ncbi:pyridoxal phosphate-dependent aminotransferase [Paenibacillus swuensis]|uniref:Pyridoxal phosphate-dependent aminotransferase n=1 Tax=Paenibacillus swuensis TaxID=1178515 RepID=A0A172TGS4_9BACL|nr:aminotransferase class I/II-fold pyridoxal phosphate-dependent enzyme [Paenibacillus swuensis]ANE46249.1 pyridoxal phosphate-dependent aminotransferase [Paenibacillus swuensis]
MLDHTVPSRIYLSAPHMSGNEQVYIEEAFRTNWVAPLGPNLDAFEQECAAHVGARGAVALSSGTAALHIALSLLEIGSGDRVFCSALTFVASANPIVYTGAEPVFIDSEPQTWNMSPDALQDAFSAAEAEGRLPKAVVVVHLYGQSARMDEIMEICNRYEVPVIEDAAESLGSSYKGRASGTMGAFGFYSFNGNKIITTSGGGMLVSDNLRALEKARFLAQQSRDPALHYQHSQLGYNYRMSNILAGIGRAQLQVLEERVIARRQVYERYRLLLEDIQGLHWMPELKQTATNRWLTALTVDPSKTGLTPTSIIAALTEANVESRPVWKPLHLQPLFRGCRFHAHRPNYSVSEELFRTGLCLPSGSNLTLDDQIRVTDRIRSLVTQEFSIELA